MKLEPILNNLQLEVYLSEINEEQLMNIKEKGKRCPNLKKVEHQALKSLASDNTATIKPADIGSIIVIWNKKDYIEENEKQLSDENVHEPITTNLLAHVNIEIKDLLCDMLSNKDAFT